MQEALFTADTTIIVIITQYTGCSIIKNLKDIFTYRVNNDGKWCPELVLKIALCCYFEIVLDYLWLIHSYDVRIFVCVSLYNQHRNIQYSNEIYLMIWKTLQQMVNNLHLFITVNIWVLPSSLNCYECKSLHLK